jgi:hypothetical protein
MIDVVLLGQLNASDAAHSRALGRPFIGLMRPLDEDEVSWGYVDLRLSDLAIEENAFDRGSGQWRLRCAFHEDDWHEARHDVLTRFLDDLAQDGARGAVLGYGAYVPCLLWHLGDDGARAWDLEPTAVPEDVRRMLASGQWHSAADAVLAWCAERTA